MRIKRISPAPPDQSLQLPVDLSLMDPLISKYQEAKGRLIPLLQGTQDLYGYIPVAAFHKLHREANLALNDMYGVATFYAQFRMVPAGKYIIKMCHGTACHVQSVTAITDEILDDLKIQDGETTADGLFTVETVACLGCCSLAPVMMIEGEVHGKLTPREALKIIREIKRRENN